MLHWKHSCLPLWKKLPKYPWVKLWLWLSINLNREMPLTVSLTFFTFLFPQVPLNIPCVNQTLKCPSSLRRQSRSESRLSTSLFQWVLLEWPERCSSPLRGGMYSVTADAGLCQQLASSMYVLDLPCCTSGRHDVQLCLLHSLPPCLVVPPLSRLLVYGGLSTFTLVTLPVKHLWNRMSGLGGWLSQSSFLLMKCFLNPCGPLDEVSLVWLDPSLASPPDGENRNVWKSDGFRRTVLQQ